MHIGLLYVITKLLYVYTKWNTYTPIQRRSATPVTNVTCVYAFDGNVKTILNELSDGCDIVFFCVPAAVGR